MKKNKNFKLIYATAFLLSIADALVGYTQSSYLNQFVSLSSIGLVLAGASLLTLFLAGTFQKLIIKIGNYRLTIILVLLAIVGSYLLFIAHSPLLALTAFIIRYTAYMFLASSLDLFLERISLDSKTGSIRTKFLTIINLAWLASPFIMSRLVGIENYNIVYLAGAGILAITLLLLLTKKKELQAKVNYKKTSLLSAFGFMRKRKNIFMVFRSSVLLNFFYLVVSVYIPIHLNQTMGISWAVLGLIFTFMLLPFVLFQIPAGWLADKFIGEKEMLMAGHLIMSVSLSLFFFIDSTSPFVWAGALFFSRFGAAIAEAMQESYFYKQVDVRDSGLINLFRRSSSLGWLLGSLSAFLIIFILDMPALFIILSIIMLANSFSLQSLEDTK